MKTMLKVLSVAALFAASTAFAMADPLTPFANNSTFGVSTGITVTGSVTPPANVGDTTGLSVQRDGHERPHTARALPELRRRAAKWKAEPNRRRSL